MSDDTKIVDRSSTAGLSAFEASRKTAEHDRKKVSVNPAASLPLVNDRIPDYLPASSDDIVENVKLSYVQRVLQGMSALFLPGIDKDELSQISEAQKIDQSLQSIGSRPVLDKPNIAFNAANLEMTLKKIENKKLVNPVANSDQTTSRSGFGELSEAELEKLTYDMHHGQIKNRHMASITFKDTIIQDSNDKKRLFATYLDLAEEARLKGKNSRLFNWISTGGGIIGGAVCIGGLVALAIGTGGVGAIFAIAGGAASLASGGASIASALFKYQGNQVAGDAFVVREKSNMKNDEIKAKLLDMEENDNSITQLWASLGQLLRNKPTNMFK